MRAFDCFSMRDPQTINQMIRVGFCNRSSSFAFCLRTTCGLLVVKSKVTMDRIFYKPISLTTNVEAQLNNIFQLTSSVRKNPAAFAVGCQFELTLYYYQLGWMVEERLLTMET